MSNLTKKQLIEIKNTLLALIDMHGHHLDQDSQDAVSHYITHEEYEMAFEGFFLEMINKKVNSSKFLVYVDLGKNLGLDKESVFDGDFWNKFSIWIEST